MDVRKSRASAFVVHRIPAAAVDWFMEWQRGVNAAAEAFAGYDGTDIYPPSEGQGDEWVVLIHFADDASLRQWLASSVRAQWVEKLRAKLGDFDLKTFSGGFGPWFADLTRGPAAAPPSWKMALTVLLGLYPTVMLLTILVGPKTEPLGLAVSMLIGNAISICILQWLVMPGLTSLLGPWLKSRMDRNKSLSIGGLVLILVLLALMTLAFRWVKG